MPLYAKVAHARQRRRLSGVAAEAVFGDIYRRNGWRGEESVSGSGSGLEQTSFVAKALPELLKKYSVRSLLDVPCGDFSWMRYVDLSGISYVGADVVTQLVEQSRLNATWKELTFRKLDLLVDDLPQVDLVFCRDCLVHFCFADVRSALVNIERSQAEYLLTTTFTERPENAEIATGQWRPLNLEVPPFNFPSPLDSIREHCTEGGGLYADKSLALWRVSDIAASVRGLSESVG